MAFSCVSILMSAMSDLHHHVGRKKILVADVVMYVYDMEEHC